MAAQDVVAWTQTRVLAVVSKVKSAPAFPKDGRLGSGGTCFAFATNCRFSLAGGFDYAIFNLRIEILIPRRGLVDAFTWFSGVPELVAGIFTADPTCGGNAQTFAGDIVAELSTDVIDSIPVIGYIITVQDVKVK
jgi:hypothetical protein